MLLTTHNDLARVGGVLGHKIGEGVATAVTAPALALLMAGFARAFLDHILGEAAQAARAAGDGRICVWEGHHR
jgi:hypothetical protein